MFRSYLSAAILTAAAAVAARILAAGKWLDLFYHDRYVVVAPFHILFAGVFLFAVAAIVALAFRRLTQCELSNVLGHVHLAGTAAALAAMFWAAVTLGHDPSNPPSHDVGEPVALNFSVSLVFLVAVQLVLPLNLLWSWWQGRLKRTT